MELGEAEHPDQGTHEAGSGFTGRCCDGLLALALIFVPLLFSTSFREFSFFKSVVMMSLIGAAAVLAAMESPKRLLSSGSSMVLVALVCYICGLSVMHPSADSLQAVAYLVSLLLLLYLVATRVAFWPGPALAVCLGLPLTIDLILSFLQMFGIGVLPATAGSFGTRHGLLVGTTGNPNENAWYLLLSAILLASLWSARTRVPARKLLLAAVFSLITALIIVNRSKAALGALPVAGLIVVGKKLTGRIRTAALAGLVVASLLALVLLARWNGLGALSGRVYLARISAGLTIENYGLPAGPGDYARAFPMAQADLLEAQPEMLPFYSEIAHAHFDVLEILYELGLPGLVLIALFLVLAGRGGRRLAGPTPGGILAASVVGLFLGLTGYLLFSPAAAMVWILAAGLWMARNASAGTVHGRVSGWLRRMALFGAGCLLSLTAALGAFGELRLTSALEALRQGRGREALDLAEAAARYWPTSDTLFYRGNIELAAGLPRRAARSYRTSFDLRPRPQTAHNLWLVLDGLNRHREAETWRRMARFLEPVEVRTMSPRKR